MAEAMVTGRMTAQKKLAGNRILAREHLKPSQAINLMYQRLIDERNAQFLKASAETIDPVQLEEALAFVDRLSEPHRSRFDDMTDAEIKTERLRTKGLM